MLTANDKQNLTLSGSTLSIQRWNAITLPSSADNLWNHTATANIQLWSNWLSGDGTNKGLRISMNWEVGIGAAPGSWNALDVNGNIVSNWPGARGANISLSLPAVTNASYLRLSRIGWQTWYLQSPVSSASMEFSEAGVSRLFMQSGGRIWLWTSTPSFKLELSWTGSTSDRKIGINGTQVVYLPDQAASAFQGSMFIGNGGGAISHTTWTEGEYNTGVGVGALFWNTVGQRNTAIGHESMYSNSTGWYNVGFGMYSLRSNTTGSQNTAVWQSALFNNTTASNNTAIGYSALLNNSTGNSNTANGSYSLLSNTIGSDNTANGFWSLLSNTTGSNNTANGDRTLYYNTTGYNNTALGVGSLFSNQSGANLVAIGYNSQYYAFDSTGGNGQNTSVGFSALRGSTTASNNTGYNNTVIGYESMLVNVNGSNNTALGLQTLYSNTSGAWNTASGMRSLFNNTTGSQNTAYGYGSLINNTTGTYNTVSGYQSQNANTIGYANSSFGANAMFSNITGNNGTAIGASSQYYANNTLTAWDNTNTSVGYNSLRGSNIAANNTWTDNTSIGRDSMLSNTSWWSNVALGWRSLMSNTTWIANTAIGTQALGANTTASNNTAVGYQSLMKSNTAGAITNVAIGNYSMVENLSGGENTVIGFEALKNSTGWSDNVVGGYQAYRNARGNQGTIIGAYAGLDQTSGNNNTYIGYNTARWITTGTSNTILWANVTWLGAWLSNNIIIADGAGNRRINVDNTGNVWIGTNTPSSKLEIDGNSAGNALNIYAASNTYGMSLNWGATIWQSNGALISAGTNSSDTAFYVRNYAWSNPILYARWDGNVGIGTTNPTEKLDLGGGNIKMGYEIKSTIVVYNPWSGTSYWAVAQCPSWKQLLGGSCTSGGGTTGGTAAYSDQFQCYVNSAYSNRQVNAICANIK
jgi:hypothetical protein